MPKRWATALVRGVLAAGLFAGTALAQGDDLIEEVPVDRPAPTAAPTPAPPAPKPVPAARPAPAKPAAKGKPAKPDDEPVAEADAEENAEPGYRVPDGIAIKELSYASLIEQWDARRQAVLARDTTKLDRLDRVFAESAKEFGLHGRRHGPQAIDFANALLAEAREAVLDNDVERARARAERAAALAPALPAVHGFLVELALIHESNPGAAVGAMVDALTAVLLHPALSVDVAARLVAAFILAVLLLFFLTSAVLVVRAFRYVTFDIHNGIPRGAARWQVSTVLAIIALMPLLAGVGPVWTAFCWMTLAWLYLQKWEQVAFGALAAVVACTPFMLGAGARFFVYPGTDAAKAHEAVFDVAADGLRDEIAAIPQKERSVTQNVALFDDALREGRLDESLSLARELVSQAQTEGWTHNNLGVLAALRGEDEIALAAFKDAMRRKPPSLEAAYNTSLVRLANPRLSSKDAESEAVLAANTGAIDDLRGLTYRSADATVSQSRAFVLANPSLSAIADAWSAPQKKADELAEEVGYTLYSGLSPLYVLVVSGAFILLWVVLQRSRSKLLPSTPCRSCGSPASRRYDGEEVPAHLCSSCFHVFENKSTNVEAGMQVRKEQQRAANRRRERALTQLFSLALPGLGHVYVAAPERAILFGLPFILSLTTVLFLSRMWPWPELNGAEAGWLVWGPLAAVAVLIWLLAFRSARRLSE